MINIDMLDIGTNFTTVILITTLLKGFRVAYLFRDSVASYIIYITKYNKSDNLFNSEKSSDVFEI